MAAIKDILQEEYNKSSLKISRVRFVCGALYSVGIILSLKTYVSTEHLMANVYLVCFYLLVNFIHNWSIRKYTLHASYFNYFMIFMDYIIFFGILLIRGFFENPDKLQFVLKHPLLFVNTIIMILTILYLRLSVIIFSAASFVSLYILLCLFVFSTKIDMAESWREHVLGQGVLMPALFIPVFVCIAISSVSYYAVANFIRLAKNIVRSERQKRTLQKYFSPTIAESLIKEEDEDLINIGSRKEVSILLTDIRKFTDMSEKLSAEELTGFLTEFRYFMTKAIVKHEGVVDKFIGDAILAIFGAPHAHSGMESHAMSGLRAADAMLKGLEAFNKNRKNKVDIGIGIHTGEAFMGNIKSYSQTEYTVIGQTVNIASRLEGLCKRFSAQCIFSQETYDQLDSSVQAKQIPSVEIRGVKERKNIYIFEGFSHN